MRGMDAARGHVRCHAAAGPAPNCWCGLKAGATLYLARRGTHPLPGASYLYSYRVVTMICPEGAARRLRALIATPRVLASHPKGAGYPGDRYALTCRSRQPRFSHAREPPLSSRCARCTCICGWLVVVALKSSLAWLQHPIWCRQPRTHDRDGHVQAPSARAGRDVQRQPVISPLGSCTSCPARV